MFTIYLCTSMYLTIVQCNIGYTFWHLFLLRTLVQLLIVLYFQQKMFWSNNEKWLHFQVKTFGELIGAPEEKFNSVLFGGLLGSLFSFLQFIASPLIGGLSDHFGRRPLLLLSTTGVMFSYALWVNASSFSLFVLARIIGGLSKGNVSLATAIVADVSGPKTRQKGMVSEIVA